MKQKIKILLKLMDIMNGIKVDHKKFHAKHIKLGIQRLLSCEVCKKHEF